uniref:Hexosyltransferase n=1 Tax=Acrobeloides nanus TaxID=290746 RepID=A0A914E6P5_9BILA
MTRIVSIESTKAESATAFQASTVQVGDTDGNTTAQATLDQISVIRATIELLSDDAIDTLNATTLKNRTEVFLASENPIFDPIPEATGLAGYESTGPAPTTTKPASTANPIVVTMRIPKFGCDGKTNIVVGIYTVPSAYEDRKWIRKTWAKNHNSSTAVLFRNHMHVLAEHRNYGDILLIGIEAYEKNLTIKTYGFFEYVLQHCSNVERVVKVEKDTVFNLSSLEKLSFDHLAEAFGRTQRYSKALESTQRYSEALGNSRKNSYHSEELGSTQRRSEELGCTQKNSKMSLEELISTRRHSEALERTHKHSEALESTRIRAEISFGALRNLSIGSENFLSPPSAIALGPPVYFLGKITGSINRNNGYPDSVNGTWMISGESSIRELQTIARTKTHVLTSETYQNNPDAFYTGFVRDLAKLEIKNIEGFKNQTSYWLATSRDRRDEIWVNIKSAPQP